MKAPEDLASQMAGKTKAQLLAMFKQPEDWLPQALDFAGAELHRRGIDTPVARQAPQVRQCRGAFSFQGFGTTFYGKRDFRADGTYVTTEWFVIATAPIIPLRSLRVRYLGPGERRFPIGIGSCDSYAVFEKTPPNWRQVFFTYGFVSIFLLWAICASWIFFEHKLFDLVGDTIAPYVYVLLIAVPALIPYFLRRNARQRLR
jgi:hypothetical protein